MELTGRIVGVTGAGRGIGAALARAARAAGAAGVAVLDIDGDAAAEVARELDGWHRAVDVTDGAALEDAVDAIEAELGPLDLFCSNAGVLGPIGGAEIADEDWLAVIDVNVLAHVRAARVLVPRMLARGGGYLCNTASAAGLLAQIGLAPYSVTKHAAVAFAEWLSITHGDAGLQVSVLCPQAVDTAMIAGVTGGGVAGVDGVLSPEAVARAAVAGIGEGRFLILPHPEVADYEQRKAADRDRWLAGMRRLQARFAPPA